MERLNVSQGVFFTTDEVGQFEAAIRLSNNTPIGELAVQILRRIGSSAPVQPVVTGSAHQGVVAACAAQRVVAGAADQCVVAGRTRYAVVPGTGIVGAARNTVRLEIKNIITGRATDIVFGVRNNRHRP